MAELNVRAVFEESYEILENYMESSSNLRSAYENYTKELIKRTRRGGNFVEPPLSLPLPLAINSSAVLTQDSQVQTPPGSKPGGRPTRGAALRARHGVAASYKLMSQTKLRRPSNFDPNRGFQPLPTIPATPASHDNDDGLRAGSSSSRVVPPPLASMEEDVFRRPAPPPDLRGPDRPSRSTSRSNRPSKPTSRSDSASRSTAGSDRPSRSTRGRDLSPVTAPSHTFNVSTDDTDSESKGVRRSKRARPSKKKRMRAASNKATQGADAASAVLNDDTKSIESSEPANQMDVDPPLKTLTNTLRENQQETMGTASSTFMVVETEFVEPIVPAEQDVNLDTNALKTRTKTLRKNKPETASSTFMVVETEFVEPNVPAEQDINSDTNALKTRTKTLRKNKPNFSLSLLKCYQQSTKKVGLSKVTTPAQSWQETESTSTAPNTDELAIELIDTGASRTRTKPLRKNKPEAASTTNLLEGDNTDALAVEPVDTDAARTRTKTLRKNKPVEESSKLESTFCVAPTAGDEPEGANVPKAPFRAKRKIPKSKDYGGSETTVPCSEVAGAAAVVRPSRRSLSCPAVPPTVRVLDPMDTLDLPECFTEQVSNKRLLDPSDAGDIIGVKRRKSSDNTVEELLVVQNAPRTRSKMKAIAESRSRSEETARTPGQGKENAGSFPLNLVFGSLSSATPLAMVNKIRLSPKSKTNDSAARNKPARFVKEHIKEVEKEKGKMAEARRKEEEALKKKQELMMLKKKEIRNQRETKIKKVTESRAAVEKEKLLQLEKEKKEREEKEKQAKAELMRQKEEALLKKKLLNQQKAQEAEERRQKEEQLRLAKLREQEEEQRKAAEARQRQVEEAERLAALRKLQQKEEEQARQLEKAKEKLKPTKALKLETFDPDNYGIVGDDGDEQETKPRRPIPKWAEKECRTIRLNVQTKVASATVRAFFNAEARPPSLREIFGREALIRPRTSSAVWATPPPPPPSSS